MKLELLEIVNLISSALPDFTMESDENFVYWKRDTPDIFSVIEVGIDTCDIFVSEEDYIKEKIPILFTEEKYSIMYLDKSWVI